MIKKIITSAMVLLFCASIASAGDQLQKKDTIKTKSQLKDGTCTEFLNTNHKKLIAKDQTRTQSRTKDQLKSKDGSCKS